MFPLRSVVRNKVIRPPAPWGEPLAAAALALIWFDVNRKVISVPGGGMDRLRARVFLCVCDPTWGRGGDDLWKKAPWYSGGLCEVLDGD